MPLKKAAFKKSFRYGAIIEFFAHFAPEHLGENQVQNSLPILINPESGAFHHFFVDRLTGFVKLGSAGLKPACSVFSRKPFTSLVCRR